jgi:cell division protein FtsZ
MTINLHVPTRNENLKPTITVVGVGGAGGNAVNNMIASNLEGISFVMANTDAQALDNALTDRVIQLGANMTQGLGAGANPDVGRESAEEAYNEIMAHIEGSHMVFITAGMGGGTGTGAAPVVARMAREQGILTVAVVTKPFHFEGTHRMKLAEAGLEELQKYVDTMIVIPNQNLFRIANEKTTFADAFRMADEVLHSGVRGVTDLMIMPGLINLDFSDIRTVMREMGKAMMGTGEATGERRAIEAAEAAISNPLLDDVSMKGARGVLINITGGRDMTLFEVDEAANRIRDEVDPDANIIFGSTFNDALEGKMRISVVATGIDQQQFQPKQEDTSEAYTRTFSQRPQSPAAKSGMSFGRPTTPTSAPEVASTSVSVERETSYAPQSVPQITEVAPRETMAAPALDQGKLSFSESREVPRGGRHSPTRMEAVRGSTASEPVRAAAEQSAPTYEAQPMREQAAAPAPSIRGGQRLRTAPQQSSNQPALWQEDEDQAQEPNFLRRMTSRFTPREEQPIRRTEVSNARPTTPEAADNLEIPAFLRRQAN